MAKKKKMGTFNNFFEIKSKVVYSKEESEKIFEKMNKELEIEAIKNLYDSVVAEKKLGEFIINF